MSAGRIATTALAAVAGFALGAFTVWAVRSDEPSATPGAPSGRPAPGAQSRDTAPATTPAAAPSAAPRRPGRAAPPAAAESPVTDTRAVQAPVRTADPKKPASRDGSGAAKPAAAAAAGAAGSSAAGTTPTPQPGASAPAGPTAPGDPVREAAGVVVDAATQQPIAGARVLLAPVEGPTVGSWYGDTTDAEGRFHPRFGELGEKEGLRAELRISKDGYEPVKVAAATAGMRVELRTVGAAGLPGRVTGILRGADGKPLAGEFLADMSDDHDGNAAQYAIADAGGAFVLEGLRPGKWRIRVARGNWAEAVVPAGGEVRVEIAAPKPGEESSFVVTDIDPSLVKPADPALAARVDVLRSLLDQLSPAKNPALDAATRERLSRAVAQEVQRIDGSSLPRRDVAVAGLGAPSGGLRAWLRLETRPRLFRRVEVADDAARIPSVPVGTYTAVLVAPGRPDQTKQVVVVPGDGPLSLDW